MVCVVANVAGETAHGDGGLDLHQGLRHFVAGAKVWGRGLARMVVPRRHLTGFRVQAVYSPAVARELTRPLAEFGREHAPATWPTREDAARRNAHRAIYSITPPTRVRDIPKTGRSG
jgi:hypothetical protein